MARKIDPNSMRSLAKIHGVSVESVRRWKADGVDITSEEAVKRHRGLLPLPDGAEPETLTDARKEKVLEETRLLRLKIAKEEGQLVEADDVKRQGVRIGVAFKAMVLRLENDLPPQLEGLSAAKMKKALRETLRSILIEMEKFTQEAIEDVGGTD